MKKNKSISPAMKKVLLAMDLTEMDDKLLSFVNQVSKHLGIEKLYLVHIIPKLLVPPNTELSSQKMFDTNSSIDEKIKDLLVGKSDQYFEESEIDVAVEVLEGKAYQEILDMVELKKIDLLVVGKKEESEGSGITARRIARKASCNILFVTENIPEQIEKILVPIDFSKNSVRALNAAMRFRVEDLKVTAINVIQMLQTDYYFGLATNTDYREAMRESTINAFEVFQDEYVAVEDQAKFQTEVLINESGSVTARLKEYLWNREFDIIVMGAKGHSLFENFLMGSVTESFVSSFSKTPVLIVR